jgi:membrane protease YdiL (CAAX protease family)
LAVSGSFTRRSDGLAPFPECKPALSAADHSGKETQVNATSSPPDGLPPMLDPQPATATPINRRRWWIHLLLINAYLLAVGVIGWERSEAHVPALSHTHGGLLLACAIQLLIFALVFGLAVMTSRSSRDDLLLRWRGGFWPVPLGIGYSVALRVALGVIVAAAGIALVVTHAMTLESLRDFLTANRPNVESVVDISAMRQDPLYFWLTLTLVSFVLAGLREELWRSAFLAGLRTLWPKHFGSRGGQIAAVAIVAVVFGLGHVRMGLIAVAMAAVLGFGLGVIMVVHRSIWPAVIAHGMFDATSLALLPWALEKLQEIQRTIGH